MDIYKYISQTIGNITTLQKHYAQSLTANNPNRQPCCSTLHPVLLGNNVQLPNQLFGSFYLKPQTHPHHLIISTSLLVINPMCVPKFPDVGEVDDGRGPTEDKNFWGEITLYHPKLRIRLHFAP